MTLARRRGCCLGHPARRHSPSNAPGSAYALAHGAFFGCKTLDALLTPLLVPLPTVLGKWLNVIGANPARLRA